MGQSLLLRSPRKSLWRRLHFRLLLVTGGNYLGKFRVTKREPQSKTETEMREKCCRWARGGSLLQLWHHELHVSRARNSRSKGRPSVQGGQQPGEAATAASATTSHTISIAPWQHGVQAEESGLGATHQVPLAICSFFHLFSTLMEHWLWAGAYIRC